MVKEIREASLCIFRRGDTYLVAEIQDPVSGAVLHRPPGGGIEAGETPEQAVRRELQEELGISLGDVEALGWLDHVWHWKGREVHERAWIFVADSSVDARVHGGACPELLEADGQISRTWWRPIGDASGKLPPLCPGSLEELLSPGR